MLFISDFFTGEKLTQEKYHEYVSKLLNDMDKTDPTYEYNFKQLHGGECEDCKKSWKQKDIELSIAEYKIYVPDCDCYEKKKKIEKENRLYLMRGKAADIPERYLNHTVKEMDLKNISLKTKEAIESITNYIKNKRYKERGCLLYGDVGTGKTHCAISILKYLIINDQMNCKYMRMSEFIKKIINHKKDYIEELGNYEAILLDDFDKMNGSHGNNEFILESIFNLIDTLMGNNRIIIITCNYKSSLEMSEKMNQSIFSRIVQCCDFIKFEGDDYRITQRRLNNEKKM
jgi:DNA replication protein DnaC